MLGPMLEFYEMFAGGGMARAGFGPGWTCRFANDLCPRKGAVYRANWGADALRVGDVAEAIGDPREIGRGQVELGQRDVSAGVEMITNLEAVARFVQRSRARDSDIRDYSQTP